MFAADAEFGPSSRDALRLCLREGSLVACDVVWAETFAGFPVASAAEDALERLGVRFTPLDKTAASAAGTAWRRYRERGGSRERVIADFMIGAHASTAADRLLTRDRGFFRSYFADLSLIEPSR